MSKHITDANKAKLLAFLRGRAAAGEQSLKTWGKQHKLLSHQAEQLADALVSEGLATREERASGYVWRAVARAEEPALPAPALEDETPPSAPRSRSKNEKSAPELETEPAPLAPSPAGLLDQEPPAPAPHLAIPPPAPEPCQRCAELAREVTALACARDALRTDLARERADEGRGLGEVRLELAHARQERDTLRAELGAGLEDALQRTADLARQLATRTEERDAALRERDDLARETMTLRQERDLAKGEIFGMRAELARSQAPTLDAATIAHYLLDLPEGRWQAIAEARRHLARAREMVREGQALEAQALTDLRAVLARPSEAPGSEFMPDPIPLGPTPPPAIATWARRPSNASTGEREGTARDRVMKLFLARPDDKITSAEVGHALGVDAKAVTGPLSTLTTDGKLERVTTGLYRLSRAWVRRVA